MSAAPTIHERMVAVLKDLPPVGKDQKNQQQGFMFRGHDDVMNALNPILARHGVFVMPDVVDRIPSQRTTSKGSIMFEVNLHVRFRFYGAAGDYVEASAWGEGTDSGDKSTNKAMTMAFKNVLNQAFAISNKEVADADAHTPEESVARQPGRGAARSGAPTSGGGVEADPTASAAHPPTESELTYLFALVEERGGDVAKTRVGWDTAKSKAPDVQRNWFNTAVAHWEGQPVASEFAKKAADAVKAADKTHQARAAEAQAGRDAAKEGKAA